MFSDDIPFEARESTDYAVHLDYRARPYLQDISLFWHCIDEIREYLKPSALALETLEGIELPEAPRLGVHVRRGDNVIDPGVPNKNDYHLCPPLDYYQRGMWALADEMYMRLYSTLCLSDDVEWCKENLPAHYYGHGVAQPKEHEPSFLTTTPVDWIDLFTLAACDYLVISGSTFGVWGAILANTPHVVRPDKIYGPIVAAYTDSELIFPKEWKVISCS